MLFLTLAVYALAVQIRARTGNVLCNPVLISTLVLMGYLKVFAIDYELYHSASHFIDFWLKPAVVLSGPCRFIEIGTVSAASGCRWYCRSWRVA